MIRIHELQRVFAATTTPVTDAQQQFQELFLQIGLALIVMSVAGAYLNARKKAEARKAALEAQAAEAEKQARAKAAANAKAKATKAKAAKAAAASKKPATKKPAAKKKPTV